ncbi:N-acetyltransferase O1 (Establishment of cohesion protein 1) [Lambiella insularis]|nr:N-acetyltransferase O1 (Establishment of cohesion protein 1) [Lambiella insularis]
MPYGVSNSFKRGTFKTYARHPRRVLDYQDSDNHRRRIRMGPTGIVQEDPTALEEFNLAHAPSAMPSSPVSTKNALFSDPPAEANVSPPSSPPPRVSSPLHTTRKPVFNFLKRKRSAAADDESTLNALTELPPTSTNARKWPAAAKKVRLTQTQIDLGGEIRRACKGCGMEYIPSNAEDAALHKEFHSMNIGGVDMGKGFARDVTVVGRAGEGEVVAMVEAKSALGLRNKVKRALEIVNQELGAVNIKEDRLWGKLAIGKAGDTKRRTKKRRGLGGEKEEDDGEAQFKVLLYLAGDKCIGVCLAERIHNAAKVVEHPTADASQHTPGASVRSSSISTDTARDPALLGIARIWTSKSHRRKGIASALLECVRGNFFYGIEVPKEMVAFSQPTESGGLLAEKWFGERTGWHVYAEE